LPGSIRRGGIGRRVLRLSACALALVLSAPALGATAESPDPGKAASLFRVGLGVYREISAKKGAEILARAVELDPSNALYAIYLADALYMAGDRPGGNEAAAEVSKLVRNEAWLHLFKGKRAQLKRDEETALYEFRESLLCEPTPYAFYELAGLEINRGELDAAELDLAIGLKHFPDDYYLHNLRGSVYHERGKYTEAIESFTTAMEDNSTLPFARINRGLAYYEKGDYDKAIADYDAVLTAYPDQDRAKFLKALALEKIKRYGAAREIVDGLAKDYADDPALWLVQGWLYYKTDKVREGEKLLLRYAKEKPDDPEGHYKLATLYAGQRKSRSAFMKLRRALELDYEQTLKWMRADVEWDRYRDSRSFRALLDETKPG
jgi:predicted Zn-dependent protease